MYNLIILISTLVFFLLPMLIISVLYLLIGLRLRRERVMTEVDANCSFGSESISSLHRQRLSKRNVQVTKMLCRCYFGTFLIKFNSMLCTPIKKQAPMSPEMHSCIHITTSVLTLTAFRH